MTHPINVAFTVVFTLLNIVSFVLFVHGLTLKGKAVSKRLRDLKMSLAVIGTVFFPH